MNVSDNSDKKKHLQTQPFKILSFNPTLSAEKKELIEVQSFKKVSDNSDSIYVSGDALNTETMNILDYTLPRVFIGETADQCYIDFYVKNPETGALCRRKKTEGFSKFRTSNEFATHGERLKRKYEALLRDGWTPFNDRRMVVKDHLAYDKEQRKLTSYTIEDYINIFFEYKYDKRRPLNELRDKSYFTYTSKARKFVKWLKESSLQNVHISNFSNNQANAFLLSLKVEGLHNKTYNSYISFLQSVWSWLDSYDENLLQQKNPWSKAKKTIANSTPQKPFNKVQKKNILEHLLFNNENHLWLACITIYYCFVRPGRELQSLQVRHIDLVNGQITLEGHFSKNKKTQSVTMPNALIEAFMKINLSKHPLTDFVFTKKGINPIKCSRDYFSKRFTKIIRQLGYGREYSIYSWKHTGNQVAHNNNMPPEKQRKQDRHHSLDETMKYLSHLKIESSEELDLYFKE